MRVFLIFCVFIFGLVIAESCSWATCRRSEDCCIGSCKIFLCVPFKSEQQNISQIEQNNQEEKHSDEIFSQVKQNSKNESHLMFQSKRSEHSENVIGCTRFGGTCDRDSDCCSPMTCHNALFAHICLPG